MATTNVPSITFGPTGFIAPTEEEILTGVLADLDAAFGGGLNLQLDTPQGQLASSETAIIGEVNDTFVFFTNMVDPAYATGRMQDAIARIYFLERNPAQSTVVQGVCTGLPGTVIPEGALAASSDGTLFASQAAGTIGSGGTVTIQFECQVPGPIACPADALNTIYQAIAGWDTVNNPSDGVIGTDTESRQAFEDRRAASVALNSRGFLPSILGAVLTVNGVLDAYVTENPTNSPLSIGAVTLIANSLYVAVVGGSQADIAQAIWTRKAPGCSYNGNTTVVVQDTNSGYSPPYPSYNVTFEIPPALPILFAVNLTNNLQVPSDAVTQIQNAIIGAFDGQDGGARARIGSKIYASRFYSAVAALGSWVQLVDIFVGSNNTKSAAFTASMSGTNMTVSAVGSGTLAPGQTVLDAAGGVAAGTVIVSQFSGSTGSTGVYVVSISQTVVSRALTSAVATLNTVTVEINQVPTISASNIIVSIV